MVYPAPHPRAREPQVEAPQKPSVADLATITCPACGNAAHERMPTNACQFFYRCPACGITLRPNPGDCCVFCSYADRDCPQSNTRATAARSGNSAHGILPEAVAPPRRAEMPSARSPGFPDGLELVKQGLRSIDL
jgi:hypothetical protein